MVTSPDNSTLTKACEALYLLLGFLLDLSHLLRMTLLQLTDKSLFLIDLFNQLVLKVNHTPFKLFKLKAILSLDLLLCNIKHLSEISFQDIYVFFLLSNNSLELIFVLSELLLQLIDLILIIVSFSGHFVKILSHFAIDLSEDALSIVQ